MSKKFKHFFVLGIILMPFFSLAATDFSNIGIIPSNIWYSKFPFYADEQVKIYSALFNNSGLTLRAVVGFYDGEKLLGKKSQIIASGDSLREVFLEWQATAGAHRIAVKIISAESSNDGINFTPITLKNTIAGEQSITVNIDPADDKIASLKKQINELSFGQIGQSVLNKADSVVGAIKSLEPLSVVGGVDRKAETIIANTSEAANRSAKEVKRQIDNKGSDAVPAIKKSDSDVGNGAVQTVSTNSGSQLASLGALDLSWNYVKYFFFSLIALIFSNKWVVYFVCLALVIISARLILRRR